MEHAIYLVTLVGTALVVAAAFSSLIAFRFGAPLLLLFLCIGLATGTDGLGIEFDNARVAYFAGSLALAVILFDSGFGTPLNALRQAAGPALSLATIGVMLTTGLFGAAAYYLLDLTWLESFLLGAAVASTDAAAVFFLLRAGEINLRERVRSTLEVESGTNDPIAIFLTITLVEIIAANANPEANVLATSLILGFLLNMGLGAIVGILGGFAIVRLVDRLNLDHGLLPIFVLTLSLMVFAAAGAIGGSGFLAVYLAGLISGNSDIRAVTILKRFQDGMSWLAQIIMFLILGLFATPSQFPAILVPAILLGLFLIFVARPIAVWLCLIPFRLPRPEIAFISWVGLRGSVPMVLATFPMMAGLPEARLYFDVAFFIVLVSLVVQGWSVAAAARLLQLQMPKTSSRVRRFDLDLPGSSGYEVVSYRLGHASALLGQRPKDIPIRDVSRIISVSREGRLLAYRDWGVLRHGDYVSLLAAQADLPLLDEIFSARRESGDADEQRYFGEFFLEPEALVEDLAAAYGITVPESARGKTLTEFVAGYLARPVVGDRLRLGGVELTVRRMEHERIVELGLRLPHEAH